MKRGPPRMAVMIPTGSSVGERMVLAIVSHRARAAPPRRKEHGRTVRWSKPLRRLTA